MLDTTCPSCKNRVKLPENTSSRTVKTMCPKCGELLSVPPTPVRHAEDERSRAVDGRATTATITTREVRDQLVGVTSSARSLSLLALGLGLVGLLSLALSCLPFVPYVGLGVASAGLLVGLYATLRALLRRERGAALYGLAGVAVSGLAVLLILLRILFPSSTQRSDTHDDTPTIFQQRNELK